MGGCASDSDDHVLAAAARDPSAFAAFHERYDRSMLAFFVRGGRDARRRRPARSRSSTA